MPSGECEQRLGKLERFLVERQQRVLEIETEIAGDLVVPGAAGVKPLAHAREAAGEPVLHRRVDVLVRRPDPEAAPLDGSEGGPEPRPEPPVLRAREQPRGAQALDVPEAPQHVPAEEPRVPVRVVAHGVGEHAPVESRRGGPQRARAPPHAPPR